MLRNEVRLLFAVARPNATATLHARRARRVHLSRLVALALLLAPLASGCGSEVRVAMPLGPLRSTPDEPYAVVLGVAQDGGLPQAGTKEDPAWEDAMRRRSVAALAVVDPANHERWLVDATPDFPRQLHALDRIAPVVARPGLDGILLTHAHVGHYTGLLWLGREALNAQRVPVYAMPRMAAFLRGNGPWDQLVRLENIELRPLAAGETVRLDTRLTATALPVPHRDEYSETVAFRIAGPRRALLWLPDIDKWERWDAQGTRLESVLATVDVAFLDGTFFADGEVPGRAMAEIPHPFVRETLARLAALPTTERAKVRFVHLNHTNPLARDDRAALAEVGRAGMAVAREGEREAL
jgi:pyrroloquinoline quinone biosynthesis protein B